MKHCLLIEPDVKLSQEFQRLLGWVGYEVTCANDNSQALMLLNSDTVFDFAWFTGLSPMIAYESAITKLGQEKVIVYTDDTGLAVFLKRRCIHIFLKAYNTPSQVVSSIGNYFPP